MPDDKSKVGEPDRSKVTKDQDYEVSYLAHELGITSPKGRVEFCVSPREHSEIGAKFEVRGNMIRAAANDASVAPSILASMEARVQGRHPFGFHRPHRSGTFLRHLKLIRMTIQQDQYEPDRWWFAPLLYAGTAVLIAALVLA